MTHRYVIGVLAAAFGSFVASTASGQASTDPFGPAPTEEEFYEAADRSVHRIFGARAEKTDWREARRGYLLGHGGYSACGLVRLTDRESPVTIMATWRRGDVNAVQLSWHSQNPPFASTWDVPPWVDPSPYVESLCAVWTGDPAPEGLPRLDGPREGEAFDWSLPVASPSRWRPVREQRRWTAPNDFGQLEECVRIRTRPGRRYRITVEATRDTSLSILTSRDCSGNDNVIRWNDNMSLTDRNSQVEIEGSGNVYAFVKARSGSSREPYTLVVEEAVEEPVP